MKFMLSLLGVGLLVIGAVRLKHAAVSSVLRLALPGAGVLIGRRSA